MLGLHRRFRRCVRSLAAGAEHRRARVQRRRGDRRQRRDNPPDGSGGAGGRGRRADRRLGRVDRRQRRAAAGEPARPRHPSHPLRPQPRQGICGESRRACVARRLGRSRRRRSRPRPGRDPRVPRRRARGAARLCDRIEAAPRLVGAVPRIAPGCQLVLPAAEPLSFPARRARHAGRFEGLQPAGRRRGHTPAARQAVRLRPRAARGRNATRIRADP